MTRLLHWETTGHFVHLPGVLEGFPWRVVQMCFKEAERLNFLKWWGSKGLRLLIQGYDVKDTVSIWWLLRESSHMGFYIHRARPIASLAAFMGFSATAT